MIKIARSFAEVYRICKRCWKSTKHEVFRDQAEGTVTYKCAECGFQWKEKEEKSK